MIAFIALEGVAGAGDEAVGFEEFVKEAAVDRFLKGFEEGLDLGPVGRHKTEGGFCGDGFAELDGFFDFREVDPFGVTGSTDVDHDEGLLSPLFFLKGVGFAHEAKVPAVELFVTEMDEGGTGAEVFIEESESFGPKSLINAAIYEGDLAVVKLFKEFGCEGILLGEEGELPAGEEGEMAELFGVSGNEGSLGAIERREGGGEIALRGFINDREVEEPGLKREDAMEIIGGGDPDREDAEEGRGIETEEGLFLAGGVCGF